MGKKQNAHRKAAQGKHAPPSGSPQPPGVDDAAQNDGDAPSGSQAASFEDGFSQSGQASENPPAGAGEDRGIRAKAPRRPLRILGIVAAVLAGLALVAYGAGCVFFMGRFFPNTTIGSYDISLMTPSEAQAVLAEGLAAYQVNVEGSDVSFSLSSEEAGVTLDAQAVLDAALGDNRPWMWPYELRMNHDESENLVASCNESGLAVLVNEKVEAFNASAVQPIGAQVVYDEAVNAFVVAPEEMGSALDPAAVLKVVDDAVANLEPTATISNKELLKPSVLKDDPQLAASRDSANAMITANMALTMGGSVAVEVGPALVSQWVVFGEGQEVSLDEAAMEAWADEVVATFSTTDKERTYTRPDGKVITVPGGSYGWLVNFDELFTLVQEGVAEGATGEFDMPLYQSAQVLPDANGRDWTDRYVDIDLAEQHARFYDEAGTLIWESPIVSGKPDGRHDTNIGVFMLNRAPAPTVLNGFENGRKIYETPVSYWMPFVGNAIGLHDANWQAAFGGMRYANGFGSHGCVNLPPHAAQTLASLITVGTPVISHW